MLCLTKSEKPERIYSGAVEFIIGLMADGWSQADILSNYPHLTHEDVIACLGYARDVLMAEKVFPSAA